MAYETPRDIVQGVASLCVFSRYIIANDTLAGPVMHFSCWLTLLNFTLLHRARFCPYMREIVLP